MTEKQIKQVKAQLPEGETLNRMYRSYEGDIRVISRDRKGNEHRYSENHKEPDSSSVQMF